MLNPQPCVLPRKADEQSALNKILQETATYASLFILSSFYLIFGIFIYFRNVIDVAALDSHNLQQHEYVERSKLYRIRIHQICTPSRLLLQKQYFLLQDVPAPDSVLSTNPISQDDINLVGYKF